MAASASRNSGSATRARNAGTARRDDLAVDGAGLRAPAERHGGNLPPVPNPRPDVPVATIGGLPVELFLCKLRYVVDYGAA